jgi:DNA-binding IclR family transcriptional regulator
VSKRAAEKALPTGREGEGGVQAVERALTLLEAFRDDDDPLPLAELAARTGLHKSTLLRLADTLLRRRYLERLADGRFRVGASAFRLGTVYSNSQVPGDALRPQMRLLASIVNESVGFYVVDGAQRVCLYRINVDRPLGYRMRVGDTHPLPEAATGRVLAAFLGTEGEPYEAIRARGSWAASGERDPDLASISAPVFGVGQVLIGAMTVGGPRRRVAEAESAVETALRAAAARCTEALGGDPRLLTLAVKPLGAMEGT